MGRITGELGQRKARHLPPLPFETGQRNGGAIFMNINSVIGNFMRYNNGIDAILLQGFSHPENKNGFLYLLISILGPKLFWNM